MNFNRKTLAATVFLAGACISGVASAETTKMVGGAAMYPSKNIIQNAVNSKDNTTLVAAVKAAGLVDTLQGPGPFTVFAPTNAAFAQLPPGTVESLLKPENKGQLTTVLTYHVVPGHLATADLKNAVKEGGGQATFTTEAADDHGKGKDFRHHRFERPHRAHHDRRCSAIERRDSCHQQGSDALNGLMQG